MMIDEMVLDLNTKGIVGIFCGYSATDQNVWAIICVFGDVWPSEVKYWFLFA